MSGCVAASLELGRRAAHTEATIETLQQRWVLQRYWDVSVDHDQVNRLARSAAPHGAEAPATARCD